MFNQTNNPAEKLKRQFLLLPLFGLLGLAAANWFSAVLHPPDPRSRVPVHTAIFAAGLLLYSLAGVCACVCRTLTGRWIAFALGVAIMVIPAMLPLESETQLVGGVSNEGLGWLAFFLIATSAPVWLALLNPSQDDGQSNRKPRLAVLFMVGGLLACGLALAFLAAGAFAGAFGSGRGGPPDEASYAVAGLYIYFVSGAIACLLEYQGGQVVLCLLGHGCAILAPIIFLRRSSWGTLLFTVSLCSMALFAIVWWQLLKKPSSRHRRRRHRST